VSGVLLAISTDAVTREVPNSYPGIKDGCEGATIDFVRPHAGCGFYIDDNGMLENQPLNVVASVMAGMALYGPVVLTAADPDDEGDTLPPDEMALAYARSLCQRWRAVIADAGRKGQSLVLTADPDAIPPAEIVELSDDMMRRIFGG
jgi:hypothetical protein